jgi:hypothetical protein
VFVRSETKNLKELAKGILYRMSMFTNTICTV